MRFIVISDSKGKENGINEKVLKKILTETSKLKPLPEFVVICGDSVAGSMDEKEFASQLLRFRSILAGYHNATPIFPVIGNHEANITPTSERFEKVFSQVYSDLRANDFLIGYNRTVYYMDCLDTRIFVLNAFHHGSMHKIAEEQLNWFYEKASEYVKNKIVFVHSPAFPTGAHIGHSLDLYPGSRDEFWEIVAKCGIDIVFSGHEHNYSRRLITTTLGIEQTFCKRSIYQVITGGGGEKLRDKFVSKKGVLVPPIDVYHFVVIDISVEGIHVVAVSSKGKTIDEFSIHK